MNVQKVEPTPVVTQQAPKQNWKEKQAQQQKVCINLRFDPVSRC